MYAIPEASFDELTGRDGSIGLIILKRPEVLNALSAVMLNAISRQITEWENAAHVKAIVIRSSNERAFSAGGDIKFVYERKLAEDASLYEFFRDEYRLNYKINSLRKPYIALLDGITMGGGAGISIHGSHRIATNRLAFSMPETGIGFFPDVGMTHVFARIPYKIGRYLALTGTQISRADCLALGLVDHAIHPDKFPELMYALSDTSLGRSSHNTVTQIMNGFSEVTEASDIWGRREEIESIFSGKTVEVIMSSLEKGDAWCKDIFKVLNKKSPLSLKVTLRALDHASKLEFGDCMEMEYALTRHFLQGKDFFEGIRAAVIDKDKKPNWSPKSLKDVTVKMVSSYFKSQDNLLNR